MSISMGSGSRSWRISKTCPVDRPTARLRLEAPPDPDPDPDADPPDLVDDAGDPYQSKATTVAVGRERETGIGAGASAPAPPAASTAYRCPAAVKTTRFPCGAQATCWGVPPSRTTVLPQRRLPSTDPMMTAPSV